MLCDSRSKKNSNHFLNHAFCIYMYDYLLNWVVIGQSNWALVLQHSIEK